MTYTVQKTDRNIIGRIKLNGSKSISNRALIIQALCPEDFSIHELSTSKDTTTMRQLLAKANQDDTILDTGAAGTTFRFLTAYLALQQGTQILTGSARMKQRPIGVLVEALRQLGAHIEYLENTGYPPLKIHSPTPSSSNQLRISAGVSSQFISALLMIAPALPEGLKLTLEGQIVSRPYIEMTLSLMEHFGVQHHWQGQEIHIAPQNYQAQAFTVEADWSAASYYYALAAFADQLDLHLEGLYPNSLQGDAVLTNMMERFGINTQFTDKGIHLSKSTTATPAASNFQWNFIKCPDIAQTLAVVCGGLDTPGDFSGLITLKIKETDRVAALQEELSKVEVIFSETTLAQSDDVTCQVRGKAMVNQPRFATYEDHRMAMAFAPLALLGAIEVQDPMVVEKSYPEFWADFQQLGFIIHSD
ncbi:MAG: 3-phosphoshikimate 1-carboxyvinyltransferase [Bacteroidota bacterium]